MNCLLSFIGAALWRRASLNPLNGDQPGVRLRAKE